MVKEKQKFNHLKNRDQIEGAQFKFTPTQTKGKFQRNFKDVEEREDQNSAYNQFKKFKQEKEHEEQLKNQSSGVRKFISRRKNNMAKVEQHTPAYDGYGQADDIRGDGNEYNIQSRGGSFPSSNNSNRQSFAQKLSNLAKDTGKGDFIEMSSTINSKTGPIDNLFKMNNADHQVLQSNEDVSPANPEVNNDEENSIQSIIQTKEDYEGDNANVEKKNDYFSIQEQNQELEASPTRDSQIRNRPVVDEEKGATDMQF